ncbi:DUF998 domain-containing protein [Arthrobacter sp. NPDC090010]|uniref:DUF998 domain-containing protein n=1 Tax=Arthrobacter sp. NPDC090010 TaxID=3363942 RepID=UPI0038246540
MSQLFAVVAAALFTLRLVLFLTLHLIPGGIHPARDTVSDYAASNSPLTRRLASIASWSAAGAWLALGAGVLTHSAQKDPALGGWLLLLGVLLSVMPFAPTDRTGTTTTARGRLHLLLAIAWFTLAYATIGPLSRLVAGAAPTQALDPLNTLAGIALAALVASLILPALRRRTFGISERIFILVVTIAPLLAAVALVAH